MEMDEITIDYILKTHGCAMEELRQQEMNVNIEILLLAGIQMMNLFLNHVYQYEEMVRRQAQKDGQGQKDVMMETQTMKTDRVIEIQL